MANVMKVVVLCPNGRRQSVKVTPNTSILEILEEACKKQGFDPSEYHLRHFNKQLDLSLSVCFANLPNNTLLELKPAEKIRNESPVTVALQLESGERVLSDFMPSTSLQEIIQSYVLPDNQSGEPICIYMRQQFTGDQLKTTTLRNLGMIGGKTILRLIHRPLETLSSQAHVSSPLMKPPEEVPIPHKNVPLKSIGHDVIKQPRLDYDHESSKDLAKFEKDLQFTGKAESSSGRIPTRENENFSTDNMQVTYGENLSSTKIESESDSEAMDCETVDTVEEIGEIKFLGTRNAILFNLEDIAEVKKEDIPPDFFDLTIKDVQYLIADYKRIREQLESEPLMLKSQREARMLQQYSCYKQAVIRVYFPDMLVLQGTFIAEETVQSVIDFVRQYLENQEEDFYLYVTPPKTKLSPEMTLLEARLVPAAIVHFGSNEPWYIHPTYRTQISDPRAAWKIAAQHMQKSEGSISLENYVGPASFGVTNNYDQNTAPAQTLEQKDTSHRSTTSTNTEGVRPKWFKLGNK